MTEMAKIKKFIKKAKYDNITQYTNGFKVKIPGKERVIDLYIILKESSISFRCEGLKISGGDLCGIFEHLLRLNNTSLMAKWGLNEDRAVFVGYERLLKDLDFSEFFGATEIVIGAYEEHMESLKKYL
ncbi:MAG: hypothetical protein QGH39_01240 [Candidatus Thermoplasmatota archaeon]|jgi:hypothetical protein|nr:hypothetical protein [Candidatus Thermoplasmatota archaeon]MDP7264164.1 hypothetical protein [Candidatus Thermoplasmatota archaeon]